MHNIMETYPYTRFRELALRHTQLRMSNAVWYLLVSPIGSIRTGVCCESPIRIKFVQLCTEILPYLMLILEETANPDAVIVYLERFLNRSTRPAGYGANTRRNPRSIEYWCGYLPGSQFLTEILLHHPEYFTQLVTLPQLVAHKTTPQLRDEIEAFSATIAINQNPNARMDIFRQFQRREFLRIGVCDLLELYDLPAVTSQLSNLADSLVTACLDLASHANRYQHRGISQLWQWAN